MPSIEYAPVSCAPRSFLGLNVTTVGMSEVDRPKAFKNVPCTSNKCHNYGSNCAFCTDQ